MLSDAARFGSSYLSKLGWDASKGLGPSGEGRLSHIKVNQKLDMLGIGAAQQRDPNGVAWKQNQEFESVLRRLNEGLAKEDSENVEVKMETLKVDEEEEKNEKKVERKRKRKEAEAGGSTEAGDKSKKKKKKSAEVEEVKVKVTTEELIHAVIPLDEATPVAPQKLYVPRVKAYV
jgi:Pin2-interacting protein X1